MLETWRKARDSQLSMQLSHFPLLCVRNVGGQIYFPNVG